MLGRMQLAIPAVLCSLYLFGTLSFVSAQRAYPDALRRDIERARDKVYPAVVNILAVTRYFSEGRAQRSPSGGSGVIVTPQGHVLTNYHVAGNSTRITCSLTTGETLEATVVAHDPLTDLSILKLRADPKRRFPYAILGNSDALKVGEYVLAMGNPLMLSSSATLGIISNTRRVFTDFTQTELEEMELDEGESTGLLTRWIQHDALILPGNSGGPLVNLKGEVVGINELGGRGMGFAIPSNLARNVLQQVLKAGRIQRGWLGVTVLPVEKLGRKTGVLVSSIFPGSPAQKAGIQPGDIILSIDGLATNARFFEEIPLFYQKMASLPIGKKVSIRLLRGGKPRTVAAVTTQWERSRGDEDEFREAGITAQNITRAMMVARKLATQQGVLVTGVRPGYPFDSARPNLKSNDIITSVNNTATPHLAALRKALSAAAQNGGEAIVHFRRGEEHLVTVVKLTTPPPDTIGGELAKPWLGVKTQVVTTEIAKAVGVDQARGFRITEVYPWTEAGKAGLRIGDIILAVNDTELEASRPQDADELQQLIEELSVGEQVELTILRRGKTQKVSVTLEETPASGETARRVRQKELEFVVRDITPLDRMEHRWSRDQKGVLVVECTTGGWANLAGLRSDDLILSINSTAIADTHAFEQAMARVVRERPKVIRIFLRRDGRTHFVFIEPDWAKLVP
ncbi:MAG: PDZ domain-containing protein [Armatimonadota bacterium]|nr:PDZ domain-containing protein [bacterium]MDW8321181.1 PDZ domain-containing protein [Armatimonadota bacterium]